MPLIQKLNSWHKTKLGYFIFMLIEFLVTVGWISLAIDRGNLWYYLFALVFLVGSLQNFTKLIGTFTYGRRKKR